MDPNNQDTELSFPGAGQPQKPSEPGATPAQEEQVGGNESEVKKLLQSPELKAWREQVRDEIKEEVIREAQSRTDKAIAAQQRKVEQAVEGMKAQIKAAKDAGAEIDPKTEEALIAQARANAQNAPSAEPSSEEVQEPGQDPAPGDPQTVDVDARVAELKALIGDEFMIRDKDQEAALLNGITDPDKWVDTLKAAMIAKRNRLGGARQGRSPGGLVTGGLQSPISQNNDPQDLLRQAFEKN